VLMPAKGLLDEKLDWPQPILFGDGEGDRDPLSLSLKELNTLRRLPVEETEDARDRDSAVG